MSTKTPVTVQVVKQLSGLAVMAAFFWTLKYVLDYSAKTPTFSGWQLVAVLGLIILVQLIFSVVFYMPNKLDELLKFLQPVSNGAGKAVENVGSIGIEKKQDPPSA